MAKPVPTGLFVSMFLLLVVVSACLWTAVTGAVWHWPVVLLAVGMSLLVARIITKGPP